MLDEQFPVAICADFVADWTAQTRQTLAQAGFSGPFTDSEVAIAWFNLQNRAIHPRPRRTLRAKEFQCPPKFARAIADLLAESEAGRSLIGYLSKKIAFDAMYTDGLLNDWQVHHFHLGGTVDASGFVKRTGELLFALVAPDTLHLLHVGDHDDFSRAELFARIARNWPELVEQRRLPAADPKQNLISDVERSQLRKGRAYAATVVDDDAFIPAGLGAVMSGTSVKVIVQVQQLYHVLQCLENYVRDHSPEFVDEIRRAGYSPDATVRLQLDFGRDRVLALHPETGASFDISSALL